MTARDTPDAGRPAAPPPARSRRAGGSRGTRWRRAISETELVAAGGLAQECLRAGEDRTTRTGERCERCGRRTLRIRAAVSRLHGGGSVLHAAARCTACGVAYGVTGFQYANRVEWRVDRQPTSLRDRVTDMVKHAHNLGHAAVTSATPCVSCGGVYTVALHRAGSCTYHGAAWCERCGRHVDAAGSVLDDVPGGRVIWLAWVSRRPAAVQEVA